MLLSLSIRNIVLIEKLDLDFSRGFCVMTGETGAGKSILLDALGLALGRRGDAALVRTGTEKGEVSAEFSVASLPHLKEFLLQHDIEDDTLLLRRTVTTDGRGKSFINDRPVTLSLLKEMGQQLLEVHGQFDHLLDAKSHRQVLDTYGNIDLGPVKTFYTLWKAHEKELKALREKLATAQEREAFLRFTVEELKQLNPQQGEFSSLDEKRQQIAHYGKIAESLGEAYKHLDHGLVSSLSQALKAVQKVSELRPKDLEPIVTGLDQATVEIEEALHTLNSILSESDEDLFEVERIQGRLYELRMMAKKHHVDPDELAEFWQGQEYELQQITAGDDHIIELENKVAHARKSYAGEALKVRQARETLALQLAQQIKAELAPLKLGDADLDIRVMPLDEPQWSSSGMDHVEFYVRMNPGSAFGPLAKIASGGERSRLMLALKVVLADNTAMPTLIFDEIDAGTSGSVASAIGERLKVLSKNMQVMSITHSPQVAAFGDQHHFVSKSSEGGHTFTRVRELNAAEREEELARLLSGETITSAARLAAKELMGAA